jgi:two-component system sensor histidine kinase KdpD
LRGHLRGDSEFNILDLLAITGTNRWVRYTYALGGVALVTLVFAPFHQNINATTVALGLLLAVLIAALYWGSGPALVASTAAMLAFNFFFLPPVRTLTIADPQNWIALAVFFFTALTVGQLSARARERTAEAEAARTESERLYRELQEAFERASQAEAFRQSERLKSALLDAVTHDLRTPLTSIKASVTTLLETGDAAAIDPEARQELLEVIDEESDRLNRFIEGMVELARIEAGEMNLRRTWGSIEEIIAEATSRAARLTAGHRVAVELEPELPAVRVDARAVAEVVYTLLDNARKYSPAGTTITITAAREIDDLVEITVIDEGPGIPEDARERIFDKFYRVDESPIAGALQKSGVGLGLAIARGIVEAHGGYIYAVPGPGGRGTRVAFALPTGDDEPVAADQG